MRCVPTRLRPKLAAREVGGMKTPRMLRGDDAFILALRQACRDRKDKTFARALARAVRRRLKEKEAGCNCGRGAGNHHPDCPLWDSHVDNYATGACA